VAQQVKGSCSATKTAGHHRILGIDELSDEDKLTWRARKISGSLAALPRGEQFTGYVGKYVKLADTIRGFKEVADGKHDAIPSRHLYAGTSRKCWSAPSLAKA